MTRKALCTDHLDSSVAPNLCDKWRLLRGYDRSNPRKGFQKNLCDGFDSQITTSDDDKHANLCASNYLPGSSAVANAFIACNDNPTVLSRDHQPFFIGRILCEMIIMDFNMKVGIAKNAGHLLSAELPVEKDR